METFRYWLIRVVLENGCYTSVIVIVVSSQITIISVPTLSFLQA